MASKHAIDSSDTSDAVPVKRIGVDSAQIVMAKLWITLDRKLGRETPEIIKKVAAAK